METNKNVVRKINFQVQLCTSEKWASCNMLLVSERAPCYISSRGKESYRILP